MPNFSAELCKLLCRSFSSTPVNRQVDVSQLCEQQLVVFMTYNCPLVFHELKEKPDFLLLFAHLFVYLQH